MEIEQWKIFGCAALVKELSAISYKLSALQKGPLSIELKAVSYKLLAFEKGPLSINGFFESG
jgi:hypothetical protein